MAWRDELRTASFKGLVFHVADHEASVGRRAVTHEYPFRDVPYTEDLGRSARRYTMTAYLVGANYMIARDALLDAIEAGGPGQLVHPYLGTKTVVATEARARETQRDGGYVEVAITFVEAGEKSFPNGAQLPDALAISGADSLISISQDIFVNGITVVGVQEFVRTAYADSISGAGSIFQSIQTLGGLNAVGSVSKINQAADWSAALAEIMNPGTSLISDVSGMAGRLVSLFRGVFDLGRSNGDSLKNLAKFNEFSAPRSTFQTQQNAVLNSNASTTERFIKSVALANESKAMVNQDFQFYDEAIAARSYLLQRIDNLSLESVQDSEYDALQNLRQQVAAAIPSPDESLPVIENIELRQSSPSLVVAYDLYESVARADDIVNRNAVRHPGFVPGGVDLKVLVDA